ncbi:ATP-dependent RecD-like DNA helicase [Halalkalibacterium halodurans]|uniref:SF1B family DNA helicase RecD2 n=1 Tax=Halalkalibacterium halodurans TaxID=86665 RepID=UPI002E2295F2|nr:ATP-dependent RecD-like DNA helicase [Halalkalibacterium halodurans]MED4162711.1 ATP-dependent RecD-like DNA helicase [Halalkalibacterium halodurans]
MTDGRSLTNENEHLEKSYLKGEVVQIIFRNEENQYTVALVRVHESSDDVKEKTMTVVGLLPKLEVHDTFTFYGSFKEHPRFGEQYVVDDLRREVPKTSQGIIRYLSSDRFPGIGKKTAQQIVDTLGEQALSRIVEDESALDAVPKLSKEKAKLLREQLLEQQGFEQVLTALSDYGFGVELSMKVFNVYKLHALEIIRTNPYQLIYDVEGIGFRRADRLGAAIGIKGNHPDRIQAGCHFVLQEWCLQEGHIFLTKEALIPKIIQLLSSPAEPIEEQDVLEQMQMMEEEGALIVEEERVYIKSLYFAEKGIVSSIVSLLHQEVQEEFPASEFLQKLGELEEELKIEYAPSQREAIETALSSPFMILTGGPGTGKTTVIKGIVELYARLHGLSLNVADYPKGTSFPILLVAPTGRAAKRMSEATELPATTIHRLLGWKGANSGFDKNEHDPLEGELLIVDEVSMMDVWIANQLLKSVPKGMQVIFVGDQDQLPSVGPGQVMRDLLTSGVVPTVELTDIYRQAEGSSIIDLAHAIKSGSLPNNIVEPMKDRRFFPCRPEQVKEVIGQICRGAKSKGYTAKDIQVLAPMYKGNAGINELNAMLQELFNPASEQRRELRFGDIVYRTGDVVLQLVNNPDENVYNGDRGEIVAILFAKETVEKQDQVVISFDGVEVIYYRKDLSQITHAYCTSIHKAQGSEFPTVVMPIIRNYSRMLKRNLLYTGITRAKQYLLMCGEVSAMERAIQELDEDGRNSMLKEKLQAVLGKDNGHDLKDDCLH